MGAEEHERISRRKLLELGLAGAGVAAVGGAAGWLAWHSGTAGGADELASSFAYDVSAYQHTDPKLILCKEVGQIPTGLPAAHRIAVGGGDRVFVGGTRAVKAFDSLGQPLFALTLTEEPLALHASSDGRLFVGFKDRLEVYGDAGRLLEAGGPLGERTCVTSLAVSGDRLYVADAGNREIIRCDLNGKPLGRFGRTADKGSEFVIPSPYFDLQFGADGLLRVANTGRHRIESYTPDGELVASWGSESMEVEGFCGCCNPSFFTMLPDGRFVTSEKGLNRIKVYGAEGRFEGVVAGPEQLACDPVLASAACADCSVGFAFDVAGDSLGRVLALDPCTQAVRIFGWAEEKVQSRA